MNPERDLALAEAMTSLLVFAALFALVFSLLDSLQE
jgi:hypothetical protein